jgi:hypothetical protein
MRQRFHVAVSLVGVVAIAYAAEREVSGSTRQADNPAPACRAAVDKDDGLLLGGDEREGMVRFRIALDTASGVEPLHWKAFLEGMKMWNLYSEVTRFSFEVSTPANGVDFWFRRGAPKHMKKRKELEKTGCAGYASPGSVIWYSPENMDWVKGEADIPAAARIFAHELGHALNLCHYGDVLSIMREGNAAESCQQWAFKSPLALPFEDLRAARFCGHGARAKAREQWTARAIALFLAIATGQPRPEADIRPGH